jgi:hypothetical protein
MNIDGVHAATHVDVEEQRATHVRAIAGHLDQIVDEEVPTHCLRNECAREMILKLLRVKKFKFDKSTIFFFHTYFYWYFSLFT